MGNSSGASACTVAPLQCSEQSEQQPHKVKFEDDCDSVLESCERETSVGDTMSEVSADESETWDSSEDGPRSRSKTWDFFEDDCNSDVGVTADAAVHQTQQTVNPAVCAFFPGGVPVLQMHLAAGQPCNPNFAPQGSWILVPCVPAIPVVTTSPCAAAPLPTVEIR